MPAIEDIRQDQLAMAVAAALAVANDAAAAQGLDLPQYLVSITEEAPPPDRLWRIHYGPRNYVNRRGGDLIVFVEERSGAVRQIIRGQ
jgi:myo-inositol-hexaphosphate 3-phosphohydrolase